ncbi:Seven transmembrane MLO family protein [Perilla frutescens var. hirtella]|uniref:MLO-like protein n=1 Tax=Perilla frutescens var. hirtella TaxID=608512 RepID=A0AAD4NXC6_PERFH|nr:Seven transmembrane MLO family protein [Perilla frutescens var. hirtella]
MAAKGGRSLEETPTWAVAVVCFVLVAISVVIEHIIHLIGKLLIERNKKALYEALEKIKSELMLLGFISLLLTVGQGQIAEICVSTAIANSWHPCDKKQEKSKYGEEQKVDLGDNGNRRRLLFADSDHGGTQRRVLAAAGYDKCAKHGKVPFVSTDGIHQLHIFIFVLAIFHVLCSLITLAFGRAKMRKWKAWETETRSLEYQYSHDPERFRFARDTSFGRRHLSFWSRSTVLLWVACFFRQFVRSVAKVDYMTLRHGFIIAHLAPRSQTKFNFQKYIKRSLEEDFKVVVGISPPIWFFAVLFLLFNTHGWHSYLWLPFLPLVIILLVGAKLQFIITKMGLRIQERGEVVKGTPLVQPGDDLFWFNRPHILLYLVHFVLFQNAFQLAFFAWAWYEFGMRSCFHQKIEDIIIKISMGVLVQILCSYVTLPLYALVTQMGSNMKPTIFNERVAKALHSWHQNAKKQIKKNHHSNSVTPVSSRPTTPIHSSSPVHLLRFYNNEPDSYPASPGTPNYRIEKWQAEQDEISWSHRGRMAHEVVEEEMETQERAEPITSQANNLHHEINVKDFSFDRTSAV